MATATKSKPKRKPRKKPVYFQGLGDEVSTFIEKRVRQTKGRWAGKPLAFEPWQRDLLNELYLLDKDQNLVYREALIGVPRKNGKSTLAAAIALFGLMAMGEQGAEVYAAAASRDQARIVFNQAKEFVESSPELLKWLRPMRSVITCPANNGVFRVLSSDAPLQHGLNPSLVVIDELHAHRDPELYYALTTGQLARENPLVVSITTAGWDRESICWEVYEHGRGLESKGGIDAMRKAKFLFKWHQAPQSCDLMDRKAWKQANPASWIDCKRGGDLEREARRLPEFVFRRLHLNQWTDIEDAWVGADEWDACKGKVLYDPDEPSWIGVDIGLKRDASALIAVQWHDDKLHISRHEIAVPEPGQPLAAADNRARLLNMASRFAALREVPYDPWSFRESAEMLAEEGLPMVEFDQGNARMAPATERIYELIRERRLVHDGDPELRSHILAAVVAETERGWRISKRKSKARIDACVALTIATDRAILSRNDSDQSSFIIY